LYENYRRIFKRNKNSSEQVKRIFLGLQKLKKPLLIISKMRMDKTSEYPVTGFVKNIAKSLIKRRTYCCIA
jgi:hypothetical protein